MQPTTLHFAVQLKNAALQSHRLSAGCNLLSNSREVAISGQVDVIYRGIHDSVSPVCLTHQVYIFSDLESLFATRQRIYEGEVEISLPKLYITHAWCQIAGVKLTYIQI